MTLIAFVDTVTGVLGNITFPLIYSKLVSLSLVRLVFFISSGFAAITILLHIFAFVFYKKPQLIEIPPNNDTNDEQLFSQTTEDSQFHNSVSQ